MGYWLIMTRCCRTEQLTKRWVYTDVASKTDREWSQNGPIMDRVRLGLSMCFGVEDFAVGVLFHLPAVGGVGGAEGAVVLAVGEDVLVFDLCRGHIVVHGIEGIEVDELAELQFVRNLVVEALAAFG